jgi:hypothetical protein
MGGRDMMPRSLVILAGSILASLLAVWVVARAGPGRAYEEPVRDGKALRYIIDNYLVLDVQYDDIEETYIIERAPIVHPKTKENINKLIFVYAPSGDPYGCSGNEWYIANGDRIYYADLMYNINNEYYIKEDVPQVLMDGNLRTNLVYKSVKPVKYNLSFMIYDYFNGRRPKYSINDTVYLKDWQITDFTVIRQKTNNTTLYNINNRNSTIRVPDGMNILYLLSNNYESEVNFKDQNDKCWPMAIDEKSYKVIGWIDKENSFDEYYGYFYLYDKDKDRALARFPRR